ncbi:LacI family DNA-binding transcriptional regulator [Saccharopolyspora sp. 5N708]|uniref:LacI family DNA-binding transcriptional regulator n=1 Tax=Saccharopolyspora sp. 5N708 TaxID=3457424 RepID=UPI003FD43493
MVHLSQIAQAAQVSVSTASRALSGSKHVAADTRAKVKQVAAELGYEPNLLARGLRRNRNRVIGMLLPDTRSSSFSSEGSQLLHRQLKDYGYGLVLCAYHHDRELEKDYLETLPRLGIAGLFHKPLGSANAELLMTGQDPLQVVEFVRASGSPKLDGVVHDESQGSVQVIEHLVQLGHRRIGLIVGPRRLGSTTQRVAGVLQAVDRAGLDRAAVPIRYAEHSIEGGGHALSQLLAQEPRITAVYAAGQQLALGTALAAEEARLAIPEQLSLVGLGNPSWGRLMRPRLTTYTLPVQELAMTAALLMISRVENQGTPPAAPVQIALSGRMNIQESSGPPSDASR